MTDPRSDFGRMFCLKQEAPQNPSELANKLMADPKLRRDLETMREAYRERDCLAIELIIASNLHAPKVIPRMMFSWTFGQIRAARLASKAEARVVPFTASNSLCKCSDNEELHEIRWRVFFRDSLVIKLIIELEAPIRGQHIPRRINFWNQ